MVTFELRTNTHKIADKITAPIARNSMAKWFTNDIDIVISSPVGGTIIADFNFSVSTVVEVTLDGALFVPINNNLPLVGRQSIYQRVLNGDKLNYRAIEDGMINRIVVGEV